MRIILPLPPNRANARGHWRKVQRQKQTYYDLANAVLSVQVGPSWRSRETNSNVTAVLYVHNRFDDDNATALLKWPLDVLKRHGLLFDDKRPYCRLTGIPEQVIDRKNQRIELELQRDA